MVAALALLIGACGTPDDASVEVEPPVDVEPAEDGEPDDPTDPEPPQDEPTEADSDEPQGPDEGDQELATGGDGVAATCDDLEDRAYDPPAEEQPSVDPEVTSAEALPDIEPLDGEDWDEEWDDDAPPPTALDRARRWAELEAPEHFGGVWLDQDEGGVSVVGFTEDVEAYAEELRTRISPQLWVVRSDNSLEELTALNDEIWEREAGEHQLDDDGEALPGALFTSGLTPNTGRVELMLLDPDQDRLRELSERYGEDRICFVILD